MGITSEMEGTMYVNRKKNISDRFHRKLSLANAYAEKKPSTKHTMVTTTAISIEFPMARRNTYAGEFGSVFEKIATYRLQEKSLGASFNGTEYKSWVGKTLEINSQANGATVHKRTTSAKTYLTVDHVIRDALLSTIISVPPHSSVTWNKPM
jgi:hypothetical protein